MKTKRTLFIFGTMTVVALVSFAAGVWAQNAASQQGKPLGWHWPDSMDSVNAAPKNHKILFENDHVRLLEVTVQPGETENMHGHKYPSVFMMDAPQPRIVNKDLEESQNQPHRLGRGRGSQPPPPAESEDTQYPRCRAMTTFQAPHSVANVDKFPQHFYRMEFKKIDGEEIRKMPLYPTP